MNAFNIFLNALGGRSSSQIILYFVEEKAYFVNQSFMNASEAVNFAGSIISFGCHVIFPMG